MIINKILYKNVLDNKELFNNLNIFEKDSLYNENKELFFERYFEDNLKYDFSKWCHLIPTNLFHKYEIVSLNNRELKLLNELSTCYLSGGSLSSSILEDFEDLIKKMDNIFLNRKMFIKIDPASPKEVGTTATNGKECLCLIAKSKRCQKILESFINHNMTMNIIIKEFDDNIDISNEFRVFVKNNSIKAISQYNWYNYHNYDNSYIENMVKEVSDTIKLLKLPFNSYVMDIHYKDKLHIIEFNPFGIGPYVSPSGSCLLNWIRDEWILQEEHDEIYVFVNIV